MKMNLEKKEKRSGVKMTFEAFKCTKNFYGFLKNVLYPNIIEKNNDAVIVVCGKERIGKSELALRIAYDLNKASFFNEDGSANVNNIAMNGKEYRYRISKSNKGDVIIFDEAGTSLYTRDAMTPENKMINKKLMVCGYKNLVHLLCLPDYFSIDKMIRKHRIKFLIKVVSKGKFFVYSRKKAMKIGEERDWKAAYSSSRGYWSHSFVDDDFKKFMKAYRDKEQKHKDEYMADGIDEEDFITEKKSDTNEIDIPGGKLFSVREVAKQLKVTPDTIRKWSQKGKIKSYKVGGQTRVPEQEILNVIRGA
jgi:excisionase family DNA binding protein